MFLTEWCDLLDLSKQKKTFGSGLYIPQKDVTLAGLDANSVEVEEEEEDDDNRSDEENAVPVNCPCVVCKVNSFPPHQVQTARDIIFRKVTHDNLDLGALIRSVLYCDKHVNSVATLIAFDA